MAKRTLPACRRRLGDLAGRWPPQRLPAEGAGAGATDPRAGPARRACCGRALAGRGGFCTSPIEAS